MTATKPEIERRRKKPLPIEVLLWEGGTENYRQVRSFAGGIDMVLMEAGCLSVWNDQEAAWIAVPLGHYVAKGALREFYPLSPQAYTETTEPDEPADRPRIVCLCGSTRFYAEFQQANYDLTMQGAIVLSVGFYPHSKAEHGHGEGVGHDSAEKTALDELHKRKIDLADDVLVVSDASGYFGASTEGEIKYAVMQGKPVRFAVPAAEARAERAGL